MDRKNDPRYPGSPGFFEFWSELAKSDPDRFEKERKAIIEETISRSAPKNQQNLRQLQWRIDGERMRAKNPIDSMLRLNKMMQDHLYGEEGLMAAIPRLEAAGQELLKISIEVNKEVKKLITVQPAVPANDE